MITKDALDGLLAITPLASVKRTAAATTNGTEKVITSMPHAVAAVLTVQECTAAHTADIKVQGRNLSTDSWVDTSAVFTQVTNAAQGVQRKNIDVPYKRYRSVDTTAGAFGANQVVTFSLVLVGTRVKYAPITQVD